MEKTLYFVTSNQMRVLLLMCTGLFDKIASITCSYKPLSSAQAVGLLSVIL